MALTNFPYGISSNGVPLLGGGIPATSGKYFFVDATNGNDGNSGLSWDEPVKTVAQAMSLTVTNRDDVIVLSTYASHVLTEMLDVTKSRVHFVGDTFGRPYGQAAKISLAGAVVTDIHVMRNIGVRNSFHGIKFIGTNTATEATSVVGEGGEYALYENCSFEGAKLSTTAYAEVLLNADSAQFIGCTFGTTAATDVGDIIRPKVIMTAAGVAGGAGSSKDVLFSNCRFLKWAGGTTGVFVNVNADADLTRGFMEFNNCYFIANKRGSVPAVAIRLGASLTNAQVILSGTTCAFNCTTLATGTGVFSGTSAKAGGGIAVAST